MNDVEASSTEQRPPIMEPRFPVSCSRLKAILLSSIESATRDLMAGVTMRSPMPFKPLEIAA